MLTQMHAEPALLRIPKLVPGCSTQSESRRRRDSSLYEDIPHLVSGAISQTDSPTDTADDDRPPSPLTPPNQNYSYIHRGSLDSANSPTTHLRDIYENPPKRGYFSPSSGFPPNLSHNGYHGVMSSQRTLSSHTAHINASGSKGDADLRTQQGLETPSPSARSPTFTFGDPPSAPRSQEPISHPPASAPAYPSEGDRFAPLNTSMSDRYPRGGSQHHPPLSRYPYSSPAILDHRRMSEPAIFAHTSYSASGGESAIRTPHLPFYAVPDSASATGLSRETSTPSLRDMSHQHRQQEQSPQQWKREDSDVYSPIGVAEESISPLHPNFSGGTSGSSLELGTFPYPPVADDHYGPSPPGTGTSTSSNPTTAIRDVHSPSSMLNANGNAENGVHGVDNNGKTYSFVSLPGNAVKKRPRRRYDEIERLYQCSWPNCQKAYGTLNHLNAHVTMQKHGLKRSPTEFKELRKQWRKAKKDEVERSGPRRLGMRRDTDPGVHGYDHNHPHEHMLSHHSAMSLTASLNQPAAEARYHPDFRYAAQDEFHIRRQEREFMRRSSTSAAHCGTPSSWHSTVSPSRPLQSNYMGAAQAQSLALDSPSNSLPPRTTGAAAMGRLPPDSTLLTPLPGYEPPSLGPPLQAGPSLGGYEGYQGYDRIYDDDRRPGTGHESLGCATTDGEYET